MTKQVLLLLSTFLLFTAGIHAQQSDKEKARAESTRLMNLYNKLEGTYQVQVIDSREKVGFPLAMLDSIEAKRKQNETIYLWLKSNIRIVVPSYTEIHKSGYVPLEQTVHISSENLNTKP
jgi:hypothetical protein